MGVAGTDEAAVAATPKLQFRILGPLEVSRDGAARRRRRAEAARGARAPAAERESRRAHGAIDRRALGRHAARDRPVRAPGLRCRHCARRSAAKEARCARARRATCWTWSRERSTSTASSRCAPRRRRPATRSAVRSCCARRSSSGATRRSPTSPPSRSRPRRSRGSRSSGSRRSSSGSTPTSRSAVTRRSSRSSRRSSPSTPIASGCAHSSCSALYRSGRQADALDAYRTARRTLDDELGLEPGPELRELEAAILRHDAATVARRLGRARPTEAPVERTCEPPSRSSSRRRCSSRCRGGRPAAVLLLRDGSTPLTVPPGSVAAIDPRTNEVVAVVPVGPQPGADRRRRRIALGRQPRGPDADADRSTRRADPRDDRRCRRRRRASTSARRRLGRARPQRTALARRSDVRPGDEDRRPRREGGLRADRRRRGGGRLGLGRLREGDAHPRRPVRRAPVGLDADRLRRRRRRRWATARSGCRTRETRACSASTRRRSRRGRSSELTVGRAPRGIAVDRGRRLGGDLRRGRRRPHRPERALDVRRSPWATGPRTWWSGPAPSGSRTGWTARCRGSTRRRTRSWRRSRWEMRRRASRSPTAGSG